MQKKIAFNSNAPYQQDWHESGGRTNVMYLTAYKGFTWYSPIPPSSLSSESTNTSYGEMYENVVYSDGSVHKYDSKTVVNDLSGNTVSGDEWRDMGYSSYGDAISNPWFPADVNSGYTPGSYPYDIYSWDLSAKACPGGASIWDYSQDSDLYPKKLNAVKNYYNKRLRCNNGQQNHGFHIYL